MSFLKKAKINQKKTKVMYSLKLNGQKKARKLEWDISLVSGKRKMVAVYYEAGK